MKFSGMKPMDINIALAEARSHRADPALNNRHIRVTLALLREVERLQKENAAMKDALEWYAEPVLAYAITQIAEPRSAVHEDGGRRARAALATLGAP